MNHAVLMCICTCAKIGFCLETSLKDQHRFKANNHSSIICWALVIRSEGSKKKIPSSQVCTTIRLPHLRLWFFLFFFLVQCCCFSRVLPSKWCYHLYMFMPLSLSVFSSSLSNALCFCLFIHQQITRVYRKYLVPTVFDCEHNVLPLFSAIAPKLHSWFYHCVGINSNHSNVCHFASSFTQLAYDLWEPFPIHGISIFFSMEFKCVCFQKQ